MGCNENRFNRFGITIRLDNPNTHRRGGGRCAVAGRSRGGSRVSPRFSPGHPSRRCRRGWRIRRGDHEPGGAAAAATPACNEARRTRWAAGGPRGGGRQPPVLPLPQAPTSCFCGRLCRSCGGTHPRKRAYVRPVLLHGARQTRWQGWVPPPLPSLDSAVDASLPHTQADTAPFVPSVGTSSPKVWGCGCICRDGEIWDCMKRSPHGHQGGCRWSSCRRAVRANATVMSTVSSGELASKRLRDIPDTCQAAV